MTVLWEDWNIVDGMYAGNLEGLAAFKHKTSVNKIERRQYRSQHLVQDACDAVSSYESRFIRDPGSGERVPLGDFLEHIYEAGRRCESGEWKKVWERIRKHYHIEWQQELTGVKDEISAKEENGREERIQEVLVTVELGDKDQ